jgi:hypothetical protein
MPPLQNFLYNAEMEEVEGLPNEILEVESSSAKKKVARRTKNFSHEEDELICSAWINVSQDADTNQESGSYWKRCTDYFNKFKPDESQRTQVAIQHRWQRIKKEVNVFCEYFSEIEHRNESGNVEEDRVINILAIFSF